MRPPAIAFRKAQTQDQEDSGARGQPLTPEHLWSNRSRATTRLDLYSTAFSFLGGPSADRSREEPVYGTGTHLRGWPLVDRYRAMLHRRRPVSREFIAAPPLLACHG